MNGDEWAGVCSVAFALILLFCIGGCFAQKYDNLKAEAVRLNFAEYNSTNGQWQWKTNSLN